MKLNKIIFPAPKSSYDANSLLGEIVYIPRNFLLADLYGKVEQVNGKTTTSFSPILISSSSYDNQSKASSSHTYQQKSSSITSSGRSMHIPCLFLPYQSGSSKLLMYFLGNAEDIGLSYEMLDHLKQSLKINILAVEHPGYGVYKEQGGCNSEKSRRTAIMFISLRKKDIIIFGRSIGSGPGTYLSAHHNSGALNLMSPYTSIKNIVKNKVGFLSFIVAEHFDNMKLMTKVKCLTFIVYVQKDALIPYEHAQYLNEQCGGQTFLVLPTEITHNDFDFYQDLIKPIFQFLHQIKMITQQIFLRTGPNKRISKVVFKENLYIPPEDEASQTQMKNLMSQGQNSRSRSQNPGSQLGSSRLGATASRLQQINEQIANEESKLYNQQQPELSNMKHKIKNSQSNQNLIENSPKKRSSKKIVVGQVQLRAPQEEIKQINVDPTIVKRINLYNLKKKSANSQSEQEESKSNRNEQQQYQ